MDYCSLESCESYFYAAQDGIHCNVFNRPLIRSDDLEMQFKYCKVNDRKNLHVVNRDVLL